MADPLSHCLSSKVPKGSFGRRGDENSQRDRSKYRRPVSHEIEALGTDKNHIHVLCSAHPKVAPGRIVQMFKSITAREIFRRRPAVKRELWGGEFWSDGYYVATVGERANWQMVERYVQRQGCPKEDLQQLKLF